MFWSKKKPIQFDNPSGVLELATRLGIERRQNCRIRYPNFVNLCKLPQVAFGGTQLPVQDISAGGCCLLDPESLLGQSMGREVELELHWMTGTDRIRAKIVSSVNDRRHLQFLNLNSNRQNLLKKYMAPGVRGLSVWRHSPTTEEGPVLQAEQLWSSLHGDSIVVERDATTIATIYFLGVRYFVYHESWPLKEGDARATRPELEQLILFLTNIPSVSEELIHVRDVLLIHLRKGKA